MRSFSCVLIVSPVHPPAFDPYKAIIIDKPALCYVISNCESVCENVYLVGDRDYLADFPIGKCSIVEPKDADSFFKALGDELLVVIPAEAIGLHPDGLVSMASANYTITPPRLSAVMPAHSFTSDMKPMPVNAESLMPLHLLTSPTDIHYITNHLNHCRISDLLEEGVIIINQDTTYIGYDTTIAPGVTIYPNTWITGNTTIKEGTTVGANCRLHNCVIGSGVSIEQSVLDGVSVGDGTSVGPFAHLRMDSSIGNNCRIGNFVEIKNSALGNNTKVAHLAYVGDADIGDDVNLGCGTITVNYDGKNKHRTTIESGSFIGSNSNLIAPVKIGEGAFVAAGSTITKDVEPGALGIARSRQENKPNFERP